MSTVLRVCEPLELGENNKPQLDSSDPRVRKLVYSMYRDLLANRNNEANAYISQKDPAHVTQDLGVVPILESIIRQGSCGSGSAPPPMTSIPQPPPPPSNGTTGIPPPPPPMASSGSLPAVRLNSEVGPLNKGPPRQIQGAMMKDKKPFTYTPGGIDLSEIRSPRMAKRIQMNAAAEGVTSSPLAHVHPHANGTSQGAPPQHHPHLPPAALAAMQPQLPVAVFPQGSFSPSNLHRTVKPTDYAQQPVSQLSQNVNRPSSYAQSSMNIPPPPPLQQRFSVPLTQELRQGLSPKMDVAPRPTSPGGQPMSLAAVMNQSIRPPLPESEYQVQSHQTTLVSPPQEQQTKTKAQAVSQQIGSIYIPPSPTEQRGNTMASFGERSQTPQMNTNVSSKKSPRSPSSIDSDSDRDITTGNINSKMTSSASSTPQTPQLNKAPTPWLNSQNKVTQQQQSTPPYVTNQSGSVTPWGPSLSAGRTIPISILRDNEEVEGDVNFNGRPSPIQIQMNSSSSPSVVEQPHQHQGTQPITAHPASVGTRIIPIHIQGQVPQSMRPQTPQQQPTQQRVTYNSPKGVFSSLQNVGDFGALQKGGHDSLNEGIQKVSLSPDESYRTMDPIQSKSFKVIQRIADDDEKIHSQQKMELQGEDKLLMDNVKTRVDESSLHQTSEPRFRGGHIPSRVFQALRSHLPPSPDTKEEASEFPGKTGPVTHNIQIRMTPLSPTPTYQQHQCQTPLESPGQVKTMTFAPSQQQQLPEPRKYTGGNIPSRSFKVLQAMNPSDDPGSALEGSYPAGVNQIDSNSNIPRPCSHPRFPTPISNHNGHDTDCESSECESEDKGTETDAEEFDTTRVEVNNPNWDEYWYYYWYWAKYWNAMGYESPPEGWETYCHTPTRELQTPTPPVSVPSKVFKNLQRSFDGEDKVEISEPAIIRQNGSTNCDNNQRLTENEPDELNYRLTSQKDCFVPSGDKTLETKGLIGINEDKRKRNENDLDKLNNGLMSDNSEGNSLMGIVEEPLETLTSSKDGTFDAESSSVFIEECPSDSDSESIQCQHHHIDRLSTIDELSETERGESPRTSIDADDDDEDSDVSSSEQGSSTSVIENRSADTMDETTTAKDETPSASSSEDDDDLDENIEIQSTVTVRLPLKLSFTKSKSYRDIATVLVGTSEVETCFPLDEEDEESDTDDATSSSLQQRQKEEEEFEEAENVVDVSYTIILSPSASMKRPTKPFEESKIEDSQEVEVIENNHEESIDFWGEIIGTNSENKCQEYIETNKLSTGNTDADDNTNTTEDTKNFWDKDERRFTKLTFLERHGSFELTDEYRNEQNQLENRKNSLDINLNEIENDRVENEEMMSQTIESSRDNTETCVDNNYFQLSEDTCVSLLSASDETSDESSSKSSSATVTVNGHASPAFETELTKKKKTGSGGRDFQKIPDKDQKALSSNTKGKEEIPSESPCTCQVVDRVAKTDNLLWRIERFLQQSFTSLGSEEDSGVMTDQSRQISDVETDNDEETSQERTAVMTITQRPPSTPPVEMKEFIDTSTEDETMTLEQERKALNYQRAKTHSRLFELIQEECEKEDDDEDTPPPPPLLLTSEEMHDVNSRKTPLTSTALDDTLTLTPTKSFLPGVNSSSFSFDSSGSLSGSSGFLSPINRDQVLVDMINQFQSRLKKEKNNGEPPRRSVSAFPSKIFKLLHHEFGEEFYDAFESREDENNSQVPQPVQECALHKNESQSQKNIIEEKLSTAKLIKTEKKFKSKKNGKHLDVPIMDKKSILQS